ncbi:ABC transporter substrate-binding protein [Nocardiopsis sediminis]|uniref:ABC transporter substrate-binding protein n=1 Tax=Nocardiopsis sediminis TaxID=1778267 RepID=A0ABV8FMD3_9ACTN
MSSTTARPRPTGARLPRRTARPLGAARVSRRSVLLGAGGIAALAATGCGPQSADSAGDGPSRSIEHKYGTTEISGRPSRVVTIGLTEQDYVLALGVAPVGVREWFGGHEGALWPWARDVLGDDPMPEVLPVDELNFEQIGTLGADLILGVNSGLTEQEYTLLSEIAPTVAQPADYADYGAPWQEITRIVGTALGREDDAEALVADIEEQFERVRADHPEFAEATGLLATSIDGDAFAYAEGPAPDFLVQLGLTLPEAAEGLFTGENREPQQVSLERIEVLEADALLMGLYGSEDASVLDETVFTRLDVAREGRVLAMPEMSRLNGALSFGSVLSLPYALEELAPRLAALLDGDPGTEPDAVS